MERQGEGDKPGAETISRESGDRFYHGVIVRLSRGNERGVIRSANGREIPFIVPYVILLGGASAADLYEGMRVGFDVSWTSRGLRVTKIKVY